MKPVSSADQLLERKARLLRESEACRAGLIHSKAAVVRHLGRTTLLHGALRGIAGIYSNPMAASGVRTLRAFAPAAVSWVLGKKLRRPALIAMSIASLAFIAARSASKKSRDRKAQDEAAE